MPCGTTSGEKEKGISMPMLTIINPLIFFRSFLEEKTPPNETKTQNKSAGENAQWIEALKYMFKVLI